MRQLQTMEVAHISGGEIDSKDVAALLGGYIGYTAGYGAWNMAAGGYNFGAVLSGVGFAMAGSVVARFAAGVMDRFVDPAVDSVVGL